MKDTLVMILAGGKGSRLGPLTVHRSKPGVPFAGRYRIIDFVLSNFVNSGYRRIYVLTQYMSSSLIKHLSRNWRLSGFGEYIEVVPAQMRLGEFWYRGTADAVYQNLNLVRDARAEHICVFGGDHVYKFAVDQMEEFHRDHDADLTVAAFPVPVHEASAFGIIDVDDRGRIIGFAEKPQHPPEMPGRPGWSLVSMGNYMFRREVLERALSETAHGGPRTDSACERIAVNMPENAPRNSCSSSKKPSPKIRPNTEWAIWRARFRKMPPPPPLPGKKTPTMRSSRKSESLRGASRKSSALREGGVSSTTRSQSPDCVRS